MVDVFSFQLLTRSIDERVGSDGGLAGREPLYMCLDVAMQRSLNARQERLLYVLSRMPRGESPVGNLDGRVLRPLVARKFVSLMGPERENAVVTGAGRVYYETFLQHFHPSPNGNGNGSGTGTRHENGNGAGTHGPGEPTLKSSLLAALDLLQHNIADDVELRLSRPGDGLDLRAYADDAIGALRRHVRSEF